MYKIPIVVIQNMSRNTFIFLYTSMHLNTCMNSIKIYRTVQFGIKMHFIQTLGFNMVNKKCSVFWDIAPPSLLKANRRFGRTFCLLKPRRMGEARNQNEAESMF